MKKIILFLLLSAYSFGMSTDQADYQVIKNIKKYYTNDMKNEGMDKFVRGKTINDFNNKWIEGLTSLKWTKIEKLPQNGVYEGPRKGKDNGLYITDNIFNKKRVLLWISNVGWRGYTYEMYLINEKDYKDIIRTFGKESFDKTEGNIDKYFKNYKIIYPEDPKDDELSYSPSSWIYRGGILEYKGYYYFFKGNDFDNTKFNLIRLSENSTKLIYTFATPSFKYSKDLTLEQKVVWGSGRLSTLDSTLGNIIKKCNRFLTGKEVDTFLSTEKVFLKDRKDAVEHPELMRLLYRNRINLLNSLLEKEKTKSEVSEIDVKVFAKKLEGEWGTKRYIYSNGSGKGDEEDSCVKVGINSVFLRADFQKDIYGEPDSEIYKIKKVIKTTTMNARENFYKHNQYGSMGGDIDLIPFYPTYYLISLEDQRTKDIVYMVYSTDRNGKSMLILDPDYEIWNPHYKNINSNEVWLTDGYLLEFIDREEH